MSNVKIKYADVAPGAKEAFVPSISESTNFSKIENIKKNEISFPNFGNPCETYSVLLDGSSLPFPEKTENEIFGVWGTQLSGSDGAFDTPITLAAVATKQFASTGITFTFDSANSFYPLSLSISWFRGNDVISEKNFFPDNATYFCENWVEGFDKVVATFPNWNMPGNRFKLQGLEFGRTVFFSGKNLRKVNVIQEIDPISSELAINTIDFSLEIFDGKTYKFQEKQPLYVYFDNKMIATSYVKNAKRKSKYIWDIRSEDAVGLLDAIPFRGGIYYKKSVPDLIEEIFSVAKLGYYLDESFANCAVSGHLAFSTCREALMQVAFAIGAIVDTSNSDVIKITRQVCLWL